MRRMRQTRETTTKNARKIPMSKYSVGCTTHGNENAAKAEFRDQVYEGKNL